MLRHNLCLQFLFISLLVVSVCPAQEMAITPLVPAELLREAGLGQVWQTKLAVKQNECLEKLYIFGDRMYALTSTNYFFCVNRDNGKLVFGLRLAPNGFPVLAPTAYGGQILIAAGNKLMQIDPAKGEVTYSMQFDFTVVCPPVRSRDYVYVAGGDRRVHAILAAEKIPVFEIAADSDSMPTSVQIARGNVIFTTLEGNIVGVSGTSPQVIWQYDITGKITAGAVTDNNDLYVACGDTRLYKFNPATGKVLWKFQCGGILAASPRVTRSAVYQYAPYKGVTALNKETGRPLWTVDDGVDLLAETGSRTCIITADRTAAVVDSAGGKRLFTINLAQVELHVANTIDARIYVADRQGRLACIEATR